MTSTYAGRYWEIDALRGMAIIMMIAFHATYDMVSFGISGIDIFNGFWWYFPRFIAGLFMFTAGISLTLSLSRAKGLFSERKIFRKYALRGCRIFGWGLVITLVTRIFLGKAFVLFGVLHLIGFSIILAYPFLRYRYLNLALGIFVLFFGLYLGQFRFDFYWLFWLGFRPEGYYSVDYVPIFPWFGWILLGVFFGNFIYGNKIRRLHNQNLESFPINSGLSLLGRNSLAIYLLHRPVVFGLVYVISITRL